MRTCSYESLRPFMQTGDVVLIRGHGLGSKIIQARTRSYWDHIGMIILKSDLPKSMVSKMDRSVKDASEVLLAESIRSGKVKDVLEQEVVDGVQVVPLRKRLEQSLKEFTWRGLCVHPSEMRQEAVAAMVAYTASVHGLPYERNLLELVAAAIDWINIFRWAGEKSLFCSEFVSTCHQSAGLYEMYTRPNEIVPGDYGLEIDKQTVLINGTTLKHSTLLNGIKITR